MFIDTEAANRNSRVHVRTSPPSGGPPSLETTPFLGSFVGQAAPPTYLEATTPNLWDGRRSQDEAARLLSFDGRVTPAPALADPLDGMYKGPTYKKRSIRDHCSGKRILQSVIAVLVIILVASILVVVIHGNKKTQIVPVAAQLVQPAPDVPAQPQQEYPIRWPSRCDKHYHVKTEEYDFGSKTELSIREAIPRMDGILKQVSGWVHVVQAPQDQIPGTIRAKFAYAASSSVDINSIKYEASESGLTIGDPSIPRVLKRARRGSACLGISVVLYVASGAVLENFQVRASHLGMQLHENVDLMVTNTTTISLVSGTLDASSINSRETRLETVAGSISGKYALYDLLYVNTISGSVNINVEPMEGTKEDSSAIFEVQSVSGSIRADFERENIPIRDYQTFVDTKVGSVVGTFIHGSRTSLQSVAGSIHVDILPFRAGDYASVIETDSRSGETRVNLRAPYQKPGSSMVKLTSTHKTISGAIDLTYPQEWEGHVDGSALNGALHLQGRDLELIDETTQPGKNHVEAKKGEGKSELIFNTVSGACDVKVGRIR